MSEVFKISIKVNDPSPEKEWVDLDSFRVSARKINQLLLTANGQVTYGRYKVDTLPQFGPLHHGRIIKLTGLASRSAFNDPEMASKALILSEFQPNIASAQFLLPDAGLPMPMPPWTDVIGNRERMTQEVHYQINTGQIRALCFETIAATQELCKHELSQKNATEEPGFIEQILISAGIHLSVPQAKKLIDLFEISSRNLKI